MRVAVVIPARFASSRLPGKPLLRDTGKYLVQHVYEQACAAKSASLVVVATDDDRIRRAVESFGGNVVMTRADHPTGTDRVADGAVVIGDRKIHQGSPAGWRNRTAVSAVRLPGWYAAIMSCAGPRCAGCHASRR